MVLDPGHAGLGPERKEGHGGGVGVHLSGGHQAQSLLLVLPVLGRVRLQQLLQQEPRGPGETEGCGGGEGGGGKRQAFQQISCLME